MQPAHLPTETYLSSLSLPAVDNPLRIIFSACLSGRQCGFDGSSYGEYPLALRIIQHPSVRPILFCPEHFAFGTPRELCDIYGGNGFDVLDGKARVLTESGTDWTKLMINAAEEMLRIALVQKVSLAILMDISAACGSQVIYEGNRRSAAPVYQAGAGVCAALLIRNGIPVASQRDYHTLGIIMKKLDKDYCIEDDAIDHHQIKWYTDYFGTNDKI